MGRHVKTKLKGEIIRNGIEIGDFHGILAECSAHPFSASERVRCALREKVLVARCIRSCMGRETTPKWP